MRSIRSCNNARRRAESRRLEAAYFTSLPPAILVPNGFEPRPAEIGDIVKIGFMAGEGGTTEWMWSEILEKDGSDYVVVMRNTAFYSAMRAGTKVAITDQHILTTYENCPIRAMHDLDALGHCGNARLDALHAIMEETGLGRRDAVERTVTTIDAIGKSGTLDLDDPVVRTVVPFALREDSPDEFFRAKGPWVGVVREQHAKAA